MKKISIISNALLVAVLPTLFFCPAKVASNKADELESAAKTEEVSCPSSCEKSYVAPVARIVVLEALMYSGLVIIWPDEFGLRAGSSSQFKKAWTQMPEYNFGPMMTSDGDSVFTNVIGHALFGSEAYIAARGFGHNPLVSFTFSLISSFAWEYLVESWFQKPSAIDLFWTPSVGSLLGELRFQLYLLAQKRIERKGAKILVMTLLDPFGVLERVIMRCPLTESKKLQ